MANEEIIQDLQDALGAVDEMRRIFFEVADRCEVLEDLVGDLHHAIYNYVGPEDLRKLDERVEQCGCLKD